MTIEYAGEFIVFSPTQSSGWTWQTSGDPVAQPVPYRVNTSTLRIVRYVPDSYYKVFQTNVRSITGLVNATADPFGIGGGVECWLFQGVQTELFRSINNVKWWRAELEFTYRNPDGTDTKGWQKLIRLDGVWDIPIHGGLYLYNTGDFSVLWTDK